MHRLFDRRLRAEARAAGLHVLAARSVRDALVWAFVSDARVCFVVGVQSNAESASQAAWPVEQGHETLAGQVSEPSRGHLCLQGQLRTIEGRKRPWV